MAFNKAKDGSEHRSGFLAGLHNRKMNALPVSPKLASGSPMDSSDQDSSESQDQPKDITSDQEAMQLVDQLKEMGYTKEDVDQAFDADDSQSQDADESTGQSSPPTEIPGLS
jgi:hypothetical protein